MIPFTPTFIISRFMSGMCSGIGVSIPPLYISEVVPLEIKGKLGSMVQLQVTFGIFISYALCIVLPADDLSHSNRNDWWIGIFGFPIIPSLIQIALYRFIYKLDTPKWWLLGASRNSELEIILKTIYAENWEKGLEDLESGTKVNLNKTQGKDIVNPSFYDLFRIQKYRKPLIAGCILATFQQLSGINTFIFYSSSIFKDSGGSDDYVNSFTAILGLFNMLSTMSCLFLVEKYGRKLMLMQGCIGMSVSHASLFLLAFFDAPPIINLPVMLVYIGFFESSLGPVVFIYCGETLTDKGMGLAIALNWVLAGLIGLFPLFTDAVGIKYAFLIFSCICAGAFFYIWIFIVETKGKPHEEAL
jgi:MFS transporter, SP family, arabinose:H+ symporter